MVITSVRALLLVCVFVLAGCAGSRLDYRDSPSPGAVSIDLAGVRFLPGDEVALSALRDAAAAASRAEPASSFSMLAISGGGAKGAYGAGVLYGLTQAGARPRFTIVTGVSTGALMAPYAFLGAGWDAELKHAWTDGGASTLLRSRGPRALVADSVFSGRPLRKLVNTYVTERMIKAVAAEHARGRRLLVATTNLDSEQLIIWDMGAIASHGGPEARRLFSAVLVASASIPGVFPPTNIQ